MKQRSAGIIGACIFLLSFASVALFAHHGGDGYERGKSVALTGVITRVELGNPHSMVYIDVRDDKGHVENWALEGSPLAVLFRTGWTKEAFKVGLEVSAIGFLPRTQYPCCGTFNSLDRALAYSPGALEHLKTARILQVGELRLSGHTRQYGMGPSFSPAW
jgi:hypothetical protein